MLVKCSFFHQTSKMADGDAQEAAGNDCDEELDELLDSALEDFDQASKPSLPTTNQQPDRKEDKDCQSSNVPVKTSGDTSASACTDTESTTNPNQDELSELFVQSFAEAATDLEKAMKTMVGAGDQEFMIHLNQLAQSASNAARQEHPDSMEAFENNLSRTLNELTQNAKDMENMDPIGEDLFKAMSGMGLGTGEGSDFEMMPLMQGMMKNLMSKDILYPSLKELNDKYPSWLESKKSSHSSEEHSRYTNQYQLVSKICQEYEAETTEDSEEVKKKRFEKLMNLMQKMQECGQPPEDLVGEVAPGAPFGPGPTGMPELPADLQEQCKVS